ncbi:MAG: type 2 lanthipeptide synthetase LanM, partial [Verrucomicrobiota bacterium]
GQSVLVLTFGAAGKIVYKPRSCWMEQMLFTLQAWCAQRDPALEFKAVAILDRGHYGWMEFVPARDCADLAEVRRHFRSGGRLVALTYALAGEDFHVENLIAHGPHAVVVDAELLLTPLVDEAAGAASSTASAQTVATWLPSVASTQLLPQWRAPRAGVLINASGIGSDISGAPLAHDGCHNIPRLAGREIACDDYVEDIVAGFSQLYDFLLAHRPALLAADGPLAAAAQHPVRFLPRSTDTYGKLLHLALDPTKLTEGTQRSLEFEPLYRKLSSVPASHAPVEHRFVTAEIAALEEGDFPYFQTSAHSRDLPLPDGTVLRGYFARSGLERAEERLRLLSPADRARQCATLRASFHLARAIDGPPRVHRIAAPARGATASPVHDDTLRVAVREIVRALEASALRSQGTATWIGPQLIPATERYHAQPLGPGLYDGLAGIALFLAAAARITGDAAASTLSAEVNATLREMLLSRGPAADLQHAGIGLAGGLGGVLYALTHCALLSDDPALAHLAGNVAARITPAAIAADASLDLLGGSAGAIMALLAHHAATPDSTALERAHSVGEHLLRQRTPHASGHRVWRTRGSVCLTGFSHGAAGYACALLRLHAATGEPSFKAAAEDAIAYENGRFDAAERNWPDLRTESRLVSSTTFKHSWCHGGPGIALARLATLDVLDTPRIRADIAAGLAVAQHQPVADVDQCCCGNLGRAEILDFAGQRLRDPSLRLHARQLAGSVLTRARAEEGYGCFHALPRSIQSPGFFQGLSGIGYALLRLLAPHELPAALCFAAPARAPLACSTPAALAHSR